MYRNNVSALRVKFCNFWPNASVAIENFFLPLIRKASPFNVVVVNANSVADISITSVFPKGGGIIKRLQTKTLKSPARSPIEIWYSGENIRSPLNVYDFTWGFETNEYNKTNFYLPVWFLDLDFFGDNVNENLGFPLRCNELMKARSPSVLPEKFACIIANNPHPYRLRAIEVLSMIGEVDVYGKVGNRELKSKMEIQGQYRFVIAFENDYFPGYVTEKVFHAWSIGSVPIYWGYDSMNFINEKALIDLGRDANFYELSKRIQSIENDKCKWQEIYSQPILQKKPQLDCLVQRLQETILQTFL